jgi:GNAT superfamily N-acetyltransferase
MAHVPMRYHGDAMTDEMVTEPWLEPTTKTVIADEALDMERCFRVMVQLRPQITNPDNFVAQVRRQQAEGFVLACLEDCGEVRAVAGFRFLESFSAGKHMYVDDLVTDAAERSQGFGAQLFDWLVRYAKARQCERVVLDRRR